MERYPITRVDALIHPSFHQYFFSNLPQIERQNELEIAWLKRAHQIATEPSTFFVCYPALTDEEISQKKFNFEVPNNQVQIRDYKRLKHFQKLIGDRFAYFGYDPNISRTQVRSVLDERGFVYDPNTLTMSAYGEYTELCVVNWSRLIKDDLGILDENYTILDELSLSVLTPNLPK